MDRLMAVTLIALGLGVICSGQAFLARRPRNAAAWAIGTVVAGVVAVVSAWILVLS